MKMINALWIVICILCLVVGMWVGYVLHQDHMFKGFVMIAEGLEGSNIELNIDLNETIMVDKAMDKMKEFGIFDYINESNNTGGRE